MNDFRVRRKHRRKKCNFASERGNLSVVFAPRKDSKRMVYLMIYRICYCVDHAARLNRKGEGRGGERGELLLTRRTDKRMHVGRARGGAPVHHQAEIAGLFFVRSSMFLKDAIRFCDPNRFARRETSFGARRRATRVCHADTRTHTRARKTTSFGLKAERKSETESQEENSDETKRWSAAELQIRFSAKWQLCHGHGCVSAFE